MNAANYANVFDSLEVVYGSMVLIDVATGSYHVLKKHWDFTQDYTKGPSWDKSVIAFRDHELYDDENNKKLIMKFLLENLLSEMKGAETYVRIDVRKKDDIWCRLRAMPAGLDEEGNITTILATLANITADIQQRFEEERLNRSYRALQEGMSRIHDSEYLLNLSEDTYHAFKFPAAFKGKVPVDGKRADFVKYFINLVKNSGGPEVPDEENQTLQEFKEKLSSKWLRKNLKGGKLAEIDYHRFREGTEHWFRMSFSSVGEDENGEPEHIMVFTTEITDNVLEEKRLQNELRRTNASLEKEMSLLRSFKSIYFLSLYADIEANTIHLIEADDDFKKLCEESDNYLPVVIRNAVEKNIAKDFRIGIKRFLDPDTLDERFKNTSVLSYEYVGSNNRWRRTHLILVDRKEDGRINNVICASQDIDSEKRNEFKYREALIESSRAADKANHAKTEFLSQMSHDIRTPLNAIIGFSTIMLEECNDAAKVEDYTKKILSSSQQLLLLINDVLDMSKIESGKIGLSIKKFSLFELLSSIKEVIKALSDAKHQNFIFNISDLKHEEFSADESRINQVLVNLLNNSVKYTPIGGSITLNVSSAPGNSDKYDRITFVVEDTGYGMSEEFLKEAFSPFTREIKGDTQGVQGTGLGLSITKNLVELMGGTIDVVSEEGKGSKFTVVIPMKIADADNTEKAAVPEENYDNILKGLNLLVAEDNPLNAEIMTQIVKRNEADITIAGNGQEAVETFLKNPEGTFDLIFMDVQMPVMNGYEAAKAIRALAVDDPDNKDLRPDAATIPIIAVTANAFIDDIREALISGMNAHISKPINLKEMKKTVGQVLSGINEEAPS